MAKLVMTTTDNIDDSIVIKESSLEEIDEYTIEYSSAQNLVASKKIIDNSINKYQINVRLFDEGIEKKVLYRKHSLAFTRIINNHELLIKLLKYNNSFVPQHYYYYIGAGVNLSANVDYMFKELKDKKSYYKFIRSLLASYQRFSKRYKNYATLKELYKESYLPLVCDDIEEQIIVLENNGKEEFLTRREIDDMNCVNEINNEIILPRFDDVVNYGEYIYVDRVKEFDSINSFSLMKILERYFPIDIITDEMISLKKLRDKNGMILLIAKADDNIHRYKEIIEVSSRYDIPTLFIGNDIKCLSYRIKKNSLINVLDYDKPRFKKQFVKYFDNLYDEKRRN